MSDNVEKLLDMEASAQADIDEITEKPADEMEQRIIDLLNNPENRNLEIFELIGAPGEDTFGDYFAVPLFERDPLWVASLSALAVAAQMQTWIEFLGVDAIAQFQDNGRKLQSMAKEMSSSELKESALKGIGKARINGEKERRRNQKTP